MTGVGEDDSRGRSVGRPWLVVGLVLAVAATLALVLTNDLRWLKLGIVAALWAALIGAFVAVRYRKQAAATEATAVQAQEIYELELEREVAARREFELEIESETRQRVEEESREEFDALRSELASLRESLQALFDGEVLWERLSLTAQATRMRSFGDEHKLVTAGEAAGYTPAQLTAAKTVDAEHGPAGAKSRERDLPTELFGAVTDDAGPGDDRSGQRSAPANGRNGRADHGQPHHSHPARNGQPQNGQPQNGQPQNGQTRTAATPNGRPPSQTRNGQEPRRQAPSRVEEPQPTRYVARPVQPAEPVEQQPPVELPTRQVRPAERAAVASGLGAPRRERPRPQQVERPSAEPGEQQPPATAGAADPGAEHSTERTRAEQRPATIRPARPPQRRPAEPPPADRARPDQHMSARQEPRREPARAAAESSRRSSQADAAEAGGHRAPEPAPPYTGSHRVPDAEQADAPAASSFGGVTNPTLPSAVQDMPVRPGGRRRKPDTEDDVVEPGPPAAATSGGGRRRKPDDAQDGAGTSTSSWQPFGPGASAPAASSANGSNESHGAGRRRAPEPDAESSEPQGSHAEGRSVSELLAAHGGGDPAPRRRRRAAD